MRQQPAAGRTFLDLQELWIRLTSKNTLADGIRYVYPILRKYSVATFIVRFKVEGSGFKIDRPFKNKAFVTLNGIKLHTRDGISVVSTQYPIFLLQPLYLIIY